MKLASNSMQLDEKIRSSNGSVSFGMSIVIKTSTTIPSNGGLATMVVLGVVKEGSSTC